MKAALILSVLALSMTGVPDAGAQRTRHPGNSWNGITPLRSSPEDVARIMGIELHEPGDQPTGPYKVEGGQVTFSYLTPGLAQIYRAPRVYIGRVFTIYFRPSESLSRQDLNLGSAFRRCVEESGRSHYYLLSDSGIAYQLRATTHTVETVIYQPSRAEVRRLAVSTECVF